MVGKTYGEAEKILDKAGFSSVTPQPKDGEISFAVSSAEVVAQDPKPGATVKVTTQIKLTISRANIEKKEKAAEAEKKAKADPLNSNKAKADIAAINIEQGQQRCHELLERKQGDAGRLEIDWSTMKKTPWVHTENKDPEQGKYGLILEAKGKAIVEGLDTPALAVVKCSVYEMDGETYVDGMVWRSCP
ncbi:MAG: PASTA domain-containing protein [Varibaculum sp.]|nr:PASTA domain-containing protein [Varibaculum sp.]